MTYAEYVEQRNQLINSAQDSLNKGDLAKAKEIRSQIEDLDKQFADARDERANLNAITGAQTAAPAVITDNAKSTVMEMGQSQKDLGPDSQAYHDAFLLHLAGRDDEMTRLQNDAFVHTTVNTPNVLPTTMLNQIWDLVYGQHAILADVTMYRTGTILTVAKHTTIVQGRAAKKAEAVANDDEQNTFVKVTLSGNDFTKHVDISYAEANMSIEALEQYLIDEISKGIGEAMAADAIATIESGINASNTQTATGNTVTFAQIAAAFGNLKRVTSPVVYCTRKTLYTRIVGLMDSQQRPIFQLDVTGAAAGTLLGAPIKIEDGLADDKILIGDPKSVVYNMVTDVMIETDRDIKKHVITYSGYARGEGALIDDVAFDEITVTA